MRRQGSLQGKWRHEKVQREALQTSIELKYKAPFHREELFKSALDQDKGRSAAFSAFP